MTWAIVYQNQKNSAMGKPKYTETLVKPLCYHVFWPISYTMILTRAVGVSQLFYVGQFFAKLFEEPFW
jgi:hypothetical protein